MNIFIKLIFILLLPMLAWAKGSGYPPSYFGTGLCNYPQYKCIKIKRGQNWRKLFPNEVQRDLVQRINRTYNALWVGKVIAVPVNIDKLTLLDLSPFQKKIAMNNGDKQIIIDQDKLAWGAYDELGNLLRWGPISSGRDKCSDSEDTCLTLTGIFRIFNKNDANCISNAFPAGKGGAKMPYCMFFHKGYALHGSDDIPGYRASHGCIRMFTEDAKWLNENFVNPSSKDNNYTGTLVIVRPVMGII